MIQEEFISWYFDLTHDPVIYGFTVWSGSVEKKMFLLDRCDSGAIALSNLPEQVIKLSSSLHIVLDHTPENEALKLGLERINDTLEIGLIERKGTELEQITKYSLMFERELFSLNGHKCQKDLIFDDAESINLIDPIYTDEQTIFPMTQALLVGCHCIEDMSNTWFSFSWILYP